MLAEVNSEIEVDLELLGSTAIEDKLQDGVGKIIFKLLTSDFRGNY